jgi:antitoxin ParD1/3/4
MNISLTPQLESMIRLKVEAGLYSNASEVVREALRLMEERDRLTQLRHELSKGIDQLQAGQGVLLSESRFAELVHQAEINAEQRKPIKDAVKP